MAQATRYGQLTITDYVERILRLGAMWTLIGVAGYLIVALVSYSPDDPGWSYIGETKSVVNTGGRPGAWFADSAFYLFGYLAYLFPVMLIFSSWLLFRSQGGEPSLRIWLLARSWSGFAITITASCTYATRYLTVLSHGLPNGAGGGVGELITGQVLNNVPVAGTEDFILGGILIIGITLFWGISWLSIAEMIGGGVLEVMRFFGSLGANIGRWVKSLFKSKNAKDDLNLPQELNLIDPVPAITQNSLLDLEVTAFADFPVPSIEHEPLKLDIQSENLDSNLDQDLNQSDRSAHFDSPKPEYHSESNK